MFNKLKNFKPCHFLLCYIKSIVKETFRFLRREFGLPAHSYFPWEPVRNLIDSKQTGCTLTTAQIRLHQSCKVPGPAAHTHMTTRLAICGSWVRRLKLIVLVANVN